MRYNQSDQFGQFHRIALLGGTFNPVHVGHIAMAKAVLKWNPALEQVVLMPNHIPAYKDENAVADGEKRLHMLELAAKHLPKVSVSDMELKRDGYTYTVDTLTQIKKSNPGLQIVFVIGDDSLFQLSGWHEFEKLADLCEILVVARDEEQEKIETYIHDFCTKYPAFSIAYVEMPKVQVSSSEIRKRLANHLTVTGMVPDEVLKYIEQQNLYR